MSKSLVSKQTCSASLIGIRNWIYPSLRLQKKTCIAAANWYNLQISPLPLWSYWPWADISETTISLTPNPHPASVPFCYGLLAGPSFGKLSQAKPITPLILKDNNSHLQDDYDLAVTVLNASHIFHHFIFTINLWSRCCYLHF